MVDKNKIYSLNIEKYAKKILEEDKGIKEISIVVVRNNNRNYGFTITRKSDLSKIWGSDED